MASANKKGNDDWQKRKAITDAYTKRGLNYAEGDKIVDDWLKSGVSTESALETIGKAGRQELGTGAKGANKIHAQPHQDEDGNWQVGKYTPFGSTDHQANFAHQSGHTQGTINYINDFYKNLADKDVIEKHNLTGTKTFTGAGDEVFQSGGWLDLLQSGEISQQDFEKNVFDFYKDTGEGVEPPPPPRPPCPTPDMTILLSDGSTKPAGELKVGDEVDTLHEDTLNRGNHKVTYAEIVQSSILELDFSGRKIKCSTSHKFYSNNEWVEAQDLVVGQKVSLLEGEVEFTGSTPLSEGDVVRIQIEDAHTYICEGFLSHNKSPQPLPPGGGGDNWWNQWSDQNEFGDWLKGLLGGQNQQSGWPWGGYGPPVGAGGVGINYGPGGGYLSGATGGIYNQFNRGSGGAANRAALQSLGITL